MKLQVIAVSLACTVLSTINLASAKVPGATHCHNSICHRVRTLSETAMSVGKIERVSASFYDHPDVDRFTPGLITSSGARFDPASLTTVASPILPDGTIVLLRNPSNGRAAVARVTDGGPYYGTRTLDLSRGLADALETRKVGVAELELIVLREPTTEETAYKLERLFPPLPGPIGSYAAIAGAEAFVNSARMLPPADKIVPAEQSAPKPKPTIVQLRPVAPAPSKIATQAQVQPPVQVKRAPKTQPLSDTQQFVAMSLNRSESMP